MEKRPLTLYSKIMNPEREASRESTLRFVADNPVGVLATADAQGRPHASTVYVVTDHILNFYFVTKKDTLKARNLAVNPYASLAVYDSRTPTTVQVDGEVVEIADMRAANGIFTQIEAIARRTSASGTPPITQITAGAYVSYKLSASSSVHLINYGNGDATAGGQVFAAA